MWRWSVFGVLCKACMFICDQTQCRCEVSLTALVLMFCLWVDSGSFWQDVHQDSFLHAPENDTLTLVKFLFLGKFTYCYCTDCPFGSGLKLCKQVASHIITHARNCCLSLSCGTRCLVNMILYCYICKCFNFSSCHFKNNMKGDSVKYLHGINCLQLTLTEKTWD